MKKKSAPPIVAAVAVAIFSLMALSDLKPRYGDSPFDLKTFAQLPALNGGRTKPIDSVARNTLLVISGRQTVPGPNGKSTAVEWMLDMAFNPDKADALSVVEINDPDVLGLMNIQQTSKRRFSFAELRPHFRAIEAQADRANQMKPEARGRFEAAVLNLYNRLILYQKTQNTLEAAGTLHAVHELEVLERRVPELLKRHTMDPKADPAFAKEVGFLLNKFQFMTRAADFMLLPIEENGAANWTSPGQAGLTRLAGGQLHPYLDPLARLGDAYRTADIVGFNKAAAQMGEIAAARRPADVAHARREAVFNSARPFYQALVVYLASFLVMCVSWLAWRDRLYVTANWLLALGFVIHTAGLIARMVLQGRPPVTNLYSSAIFVGWASVLLGIVVERFQKRGVVAAVSALIGFVTLIVAHHLASQGDTLEMMRAVLDSNFWLATHVTTITIGYSSTFLSGFLGAAYIARRLWVKGDDTDARASIERMVYGVVCFSTFFSFVGTVLGGIWADQSWGRFWGWDPKENGALMIVLWNALYLHARWGRGVDDRSLMAMAVFGNVITALSWFGVNMLGIGLHSYGFMDKALLWLVIFCASQFLIMALAYLPAGILQRRRA